MRHFITHDPATQLVTGAFRFRDGDQFDGLIEVSVDVIALSETCSTGQALYYQSGEIVVGDAPPASAPPETETIPAVEI